MTLFATLCEDTDRGVGDTDRADDITKGASVIDNEAMLSLSKSLIGNILLLFFRIVNDFSVISRLMSSASLSLMSSTKFLVSIGLALSKPTHALAANIFLTRLSISA